MKIGSISVTLRNSLNQKQDAHLDKATNGVLKNSNSENPFKSDGVQFVMNRVAARLRRHVSRLETRGPNAFERGDGDSEYGLLLEKFCDQTVSSERCIQSCSMEDNDWGNSGKNCHVFSDAQPGASIFSSTDAKEFLVQNGRKLSQLIM